MKTDDFIKALAADTGTQAAPPKRMLGLTLLAGAALAAAAFFATLGPRADFMEATETVRFLFKFVVTAALAATAAAAILRLAIPGAATAGATRLLLVAPALLVAAVGFELAMVPAAEWAPLAMGRNALLCLTFIPFIALGPLAAAILFLRHAAPTQPATAGAVAGLVAGGIAATFYAAHCVDDSPLFVACWYTLSILGVAIFGALLGRIFTRW